MIRGYPGYGIGSLPAQPATRNQPRLAAGVSHPWTAIAMDGRYRSDVRVRGKGRSKPPQISFSWQQGSRAVRYRPGTSDDVQQHQFAGDMSMRERRQNKGNASTDLHVMPRAIVAFANASSKVDPSLGSASQRGSTDGVEFCVEMSANTPLGFELRVATQARYLPCIHPWQVTCGVEYELSETDQYYYGDV